MSTLCPPVISPDGQRTRTGTQKKQQTEMYKRPMNNNYTNTETSHSASACGGRSSVHGLDAVSLPSSQCLDDNAADLQVDDRLWGDIIQLTFGATISKWQVSISTATGEMHQCRRRLFFCFFCLYLKQQHLKHVFLLHSTKRERLCMKAGAISYRMIHLH